jgi:hypothetical protein
MELITMRICQTRHYGSNPCMIHHAGCLQCKVTRDVCRQAGSVMHRSAGSELLWCAETAVERELLG